LSTSWAMDCLIQPTHTAPEPGTAAADGTRAGGAARVPKGRTGAPVLPGRNLKTPLNLDEGVVRAVDGVSIYLYPSKGVGVVGERGCGKSITMKSVLRLIQKPGRIVNGEIIYRRPLEAQHGARKGKELETDLAKLPAQGRRMRQIR